MCTTQVMCCSLSVINMLGFPCKQSICRSANDCFGASSSTLVISDLLGLQPILEQFTWRIKKSMQFNQSNDIAAFMLTSSVNRPFVTMVINLLEFSCKRSICTSHVNCTLCSVCTWYIVYHETAFVLPDSVTIVTCLWPSVGRFVSRRCSFSAGHRCLGFVFVSSVKDVQLMTCIRRFN